MNPEDDQKLSQLLRKLEADIRCAIALPLFGVVADRRPARAARFLLRGAAQCVLCPARLRWRDSCAWLCSVSLGAAHQHAGHVVSERRATAEGNYLSALSVPWLASVLMEQP